MASTPLSTCPRAFLGELVNAGGLDAELLALFRVEVVEGDRSVLL
jgi:hypothetical protein